MSTFGVMARTSATHLDRRRRLLPRDYLTDPWSFGTDAATRWRIPPGGDEVSLRVAQVQHRCVAEWKRRGRVPGAGVLCRRYAMSKQVLSRVVLGQRWAGETVLAAILDAVAAPGPSMLTAAGAAPQRHDYRQAHRGRRGVV